MSSRSKYLASLDIGSSKICCMIGTQDNNGINQIVGLGYNKASGISKGVISDFNLAAKSISNAILEAEKQAKQEAEQEEELKGYVAKEDQLQEVDEEPRKKGFFRGLVDRFKGNKGQNQPDSGEVVVPKTEVARFKISVRSFRTSMVEQTQLIKDIKDNIEQNKAIGVMAPGHTFTIEPMINIGTWRDETWPDNWTSVTVDGKWSAQYEQTFLCTDKGVEVLTSKPEAETNSKLPDWNREWFQR